MTSGGPIRQQVGGILRGLADRPPRTTIYFLFRGDEPLNLTLQAQSPIPIALVPRHLPGQFNRLLGQWWKQYAAGAEAVRAEARLSAAGRKLPDVPLATRLNLTLAAEESKRAPAYGELEKELGLPREPNRCKRRCSRTACWD